MESGRGHVALIGKQLATDAVLDKVSCVCSSCWPIEACAEGLADKCPSRNVVSAESDMDLSQELPAFLLGDASLEHSGRTFLIEFPLMDLVGFRTPYDGTCFILVLGELLPI